MGTEEHVGLHSIGEEIAALNRAGWQTLTHTESSLEMRNEAGDILQVLHLENGTWRALRIPKEVVTEVIHDENHLPEIQEVAKWLLSQ